jgi:hypothetical protein
VLSTVAAGEPPNEALRVAREQTRRSFPISPGLAERLPLGGALTWRRGR